MNINIYDRKKKSSKFANPRKYMSVNVYIPESA